MQIGTFGSRTKFHSDTLRRRYIQLPCMRPSIKIVWTVLLINCFLTSDSSVIFVVFVHYLPSIIFQFIIVKLQDDASCNSILFLTLSFDIV